MPDRKKTGSSLIDRELALHSQVGSFLESNWPKIVVGLLVLGAVSLGYAGYEFLSRRSEAKAEDALYAAEGPFLKRKEAFERAKMKALMPAFAPPDEPGAPVALPPTDDIAKDFGSSIAALETILKDHPKARAGQQAALDLAGVYIAYKQPEKAVAAVEAVAPSSSPHDVMGALTFVMLGEARAALGQCELAVASWKKVMDEPKAAYLHGELAVKAGVCFESLRQDDKALEMYRKAAQDFGDTSAGQSAKSLLRALELRGAAGKAS